MGIPDPPDLDPKYKVDSVILAVTILECLAWADEPKGVTQISREVGSTKNRVFRHLETLRALGYASRDPAGDRYCVGPRFALFGQVVGENFALADAIRAPLRQLRDTTGETAVVATVMQGQLTVLAMEPGTHTIEVGLRLGATYDLHATAQGKLALAHSATSQLDARVTQPLTAHTSDTIVDAEILQRELDGIRERGWASAPGEIQSGVNAVAAPIFDRVGSFVGTVAIIGFLDHIPDPPRKDQLDAVLLAANMACRNLGWTQSRGAPAVAGQLS